LFNRHDGAVAVGMDEVAAPHRHAVNGEGKAEIGDVQDDQPMTP